MAGQAIIPFIAGYPEAFTPPEIQVLSQALEAVCAELNIVNNETAREVIAIRIVELARRGERSFEQLRDRLLSEANGGGSRL